MKLSLEKVLKRLSLCLLSALVFGSLLTCSIYADDLPQPQFVRRSVGLTFIEDLDIEYVVTGGEVKHITMNGEIPSQNFQVTDGTYRILSGGLTLTQNGSTIRNNSTITIYPQSVSGQGGTSAGHTDSAQIILESSEVQTTEQVVSIKYNYILVQRLFIGFDRPAVGYIDINYSVKSGRTLSTYRMPFSDTSVYLPSWSSGTASIRDYGSAVCQVDFIEVNTNKSSINVSPFINFDESTWNNHTVAYESPVSDNQGHNLLSQILEALTNNNDNGETQQIANDIKQSADDKLGGVTEVTEGIKDGVSGLHSQGTGHIEIPAGLFGSEQPLVIDLDYIEEQLPELVGIMRTLLIMSAAWLCYETLKNNIWGDNV